LRILCVLLFRVRAYGWRNVPKRGGAILASNHQSFLDPMLIGLPLQQRLHFMARESLFRFWGFGSLIRSLNAFPVRREAAGPEDLARALRRLREGKLVLVFPEGTRTKDGEVGTFRRGVVSLAARAGVPVVPVAVEGAFKAWPRHRRLFRFVPLSVAYGEPLMPPAADRESAERFAQRLRDETVRLRDRLRLRHGARP